MPVGDKDYTDKRHKDYNHPSHGTGWSKEEWENQSKNKVNDTTIHEEEESESKHFFGTGVPRYV